MTLDTLLLLQRCLKAQTLQVGDPSFPDTALAVIRALDELEREIDRPAADGNVGG